MSGYLRSSDSGAITPAIKNLLIINGLFYLATIVFRDKIDLTSLLALHSPLSDAFSPYQLITHMFMHATFDMNGNLIIAHIFFNMFALWMFGVPLERRWGPKRFLIYYFVTGLGAALLHMGTLYFNYLSVSDLFSAADIQQVMSEGRGLMYEDTTVQRLNESLNSSVVGASGAVFGVLLAFGMYFPNTELFFLFVPIPIKAKYMVIIYGLIELTLGVGNFQWDNVAHWAHLGGMLFGFILIKIWQTDRKNFY